MRRRQHSGMTQSQYGVADDGTPLNWVISRTVGTNNPKVILIHGGGWVSGDPTQMANICAPALNAAGFDCYAIDYRLAGRGRLPGQRTDGVYPAQTNDVGIAVSACAALSTSPLYIIGGSAGGGHALWYAGNPLVTSVVLISPATVLDDTTSLQNPRFGNYVEQYCAGNETAASPLYRVAVEDDSIYITAFVDDHMPAPQFDLAVAKFRTLGMNYQAVLLPGAGHSYPDAWPIMNQAAIAFLNQ